MMDYAQSFSSLQDQIQSTLVSVTRTAGQISSEDLSFQRSLNPSIGATLDEQSARLLALASSLLKSASSISELEAPVLQDVEDVDISWRGVVDVVDLLLEKADTCLDEYTGVIKRKTPPTTEQSPSKLKKHLSLGNSFRTQNLVKPQLSFLNKPNNIAITPWKPILTSKPYATIPLAESLGTFTNEFQHLQYKHPYETEILELQYPESVYHNVDPIPSQDVEATQATFVDTFEGVLVMLSELKKAKEIAVDLEHHDARSYVGLVSLMQISTREKNWIIDTLKPWRQDLQVLNEVFADPKIIKVLHGAYMDIVWLQRDLGLYIVGLFDTHHASRVLGYPGGSLAYLLKRFVNFDADKKYQMADWRIRPLPEEMFFYAMADTHFLLYIFDNLRNELVEKSNSTNPEENRIGLVLQKSKETSLLRFERQIYDENTGQGPAGWYNLLVKTPALFNNEQFAVFRAIHAWRDRIARQDDDSISYVMPNHVIFTLAKLMPTDMVSLYGAVHPISHNVKSRTAELLELIRSAKNVGNDGPGMMDLLRPDSFGATRNASILSETPSRTDSDRILDFNLPTASLKSDQLRTDKSMFWGGAFGSSAWDPSSISARKNIDLSLAVPLLYLSSEHPGDLTDGLTNLHHMQDEQKIRYEEQSIQAGEDRHSLQEEEPFTIKNDKKRKVRTAKENSAVLDESSKDYDISFNNEEEEKGREKAARKSERKAQKKFEKAARKLARVDGTAAMEGGGQDDEPFDYNNAESVLHRKKKDAVEGSRLEKPFDPYTKSSNVPKGMRKLQTERPGKSFTFRS